MAQQARYFWLAGSAWLSACAAGTTGASLSVLTVAEAPGAHGTPATEPGIKPVNGARDADEGARLFPALDAPSTLRAGQERDGSRRVVAYGLRMLLRPGGALELANEYLPAPRSVQALELPERLGGGYLFSVLGSSMTLFFRAPTFTGKLSPFARLDFEAEQVIPGFDRLYVVSHRPDHLLALDAEHGAALDLGSLPPSPSYDKLAFVDGWFGAVQVPLRGTLLSFDAGTSWRPLDSTVSNLEVQNGALHWLGSEGAFDLDESGFSTRSDPQSGSPPSENAVAQALRGTASGSGESSALADRSGPNALKLAVLRGFRDRDGSLVAASAGNLVRVRASDGQLLERNDHAYPGASDCTALALGRGFGFACSDGRETSLYEFRRPFSIQRRRAFDGARYVASSGNGALVVRGSCGASETPGAYCVSIDGQSFREIRVRGDLGVERVIALSDGRVAVIVPPRLGASGFLSLIDERGKEQRMTLKLATAGPAAHLLERGLWLDGFVESARGLAGWVVGGEPFAGVRVALDGSVTVSRPENGIDRALLSAERALLVGRTGRARESVDGGFDWTDVELPSEFDAGRELRDDSKLQGCSELGCSFAGFVRVGWGNGSTAQHLRIANVPEETQLLQPGGNRWLLHCQATGEASDPALPLSARSAPAHADDAQSAPWAPFDELGAPALGSAESGFDISGSDGDSAPVHAYAWGERGASWTRTGKALLRTLDRFQVRRATVQSAVTRSPWPDATAAAEALGFDGSGNSGSVRGVLDAGQHAAAILISARGLLDLLLFEDGKALSRIANAGRLGFNFGMMSSVAKLRDAWYVAAFNENHSLVLSKISGTQVERVAEYPDPGRDIGSASVVRGVKGEELAIWTVSGLGWYLFPVDPQTHALQRPLFQTAAQLARMPTPCGPDADGFLLVGSPSLEPSLRSARPADELSAHHVEGQFIWSARGLCTRAFAADNDASLRNGSTALRGVSPKKDLSVPLTVSERRPLGRRWGYLCTP